MVQHRLLSDSRNYRTHTVQCQLVFTVTFHSYKKSYERERWVTSFGAVSWLWNCSTSLKVAGSIHDCVIGIFQYHIPSGRTVYRGLNPPLTEMSTRNISWGEMRRVPRAGKIVTLVCRLLKSGGLSILETSGPVFACNGNVFLLPLHRSIEIILIFFRVWQFLCSDPGCTATIFFLEHL